MRFYSAARDDASTRPSDGVDSLDLDVQVAQPLEDAMEVRLVDDLYEKHRAVGTDLDAARAKVLLEPLPDPPAHDDLVRRRHAFVSPDGHVASMNDRPRLWRRPRGIIRVNFDLRRARKDAKIALGGRALERSIGCAERGDSRAAGHPRHGRVAVARFLDAEGATPGPSAALPTIVPTKLRVPRPRPELVERAYLLELLRRGRERRLTLVCAPAGYGKSTLLAQWAEADRARTPFVWVSLEPSDSDPARLWAHLVSGLREVHPPVGDASLDALVGGPGAIGSQLVPLLVRELAGAPDLVVILDDWHVIRSPLCDETVTRFIEHAPRSVQLVVSSRADPGFPVARLRAHGDLAEIRETALRISTDEALDLFRRANVDLGRDEVERVNERAEGWLAGICLALLVAKERPDRARFVAEFSGDTRHVLDFLADDVLAATRPEIRSFLLRTSVLDRLSAELCDVVLETSSSAALLTEIAGANLFLVPLDEVGHEYRYHHLFAAMLERELRATDPTEPQRLHARASGWFEDHGEVEASVEHAIASGNVPRASVLVALNAQPYLASGRLATVVRWLDALGWPDARADPELALIRANVAGMSGKPVEEIERWLVVAEAAPATEPLANGLPSLRTGVAILRAAYLTRGIAAAVDEARLALDETGASPWRGQTLGMLGQALYLAGRPDEARSVLEDARALPGAAARAPAAALVLAYLSLIALDDGERSAAERMSRRALDLLEEKHLAAGVVAANPHMALGSAFAAGPISIPASSTSARRSSSRHLLARATGTRTRSFAWRLHCIASGTARPRAPRSLSREGTWRSCRTRARSAPSQPRRGRHWQDAPAGRDSSESSSARRSSESSGCSRPAPR